VVGDTIAQISSQCDALLPNLARSICTSNPDAAAKVRAGEQVRIDLYVGLYDGNGNAIETGVRGNLSPTRHICAP
jgi:hypothetical protein